MATGSNFSSDHYKSVLEELGYPLVDRGNFWHTRAVFRNGDNMTALQIYKDSGVWRDFVEPPHMPLPFAALIQKHFGSDKAAAQKYLKSDPKIGPAQKDERINEPKFFSESLLEELLPHYKFYNDKGISDDVLKTLKGGMSTKGKMLQRFVFPVYSEMGQIIGFAGRDMGNRGPKWKLLGRKTSWVYPYYVSDLCRHYIEELNSVIIVESIGDLLNLNQHGFYNILVSFGLDLSPTLISHLIGLNLDRITISFNNDYNSDSPSKKNSGANAAVKNYLKILSHTTPSKLSICLPLKNDFGDMATDDFVAWEKKFCQDYSSLPQHVLKFAEKMAINGELKGAPLKNLTTLRDYVS